MQIGDHVRFKARCGDSLSDDSPLHDGSTGTIVGSVNNRGTLIFLVMDDRVFPGIKIPAGSTWWVYESNLEEVKADDEDIDDIDGEKIAFIGMPGS